MEGIIRDWLSTFRSDDTKAAYVYDINSFSKWMNTQQLKLASIRLANVREWGKTKGELPSDRRMIAAVKSFWRFAYNQDYVSSDIGRCLRIPKKTEIRVERDLSKEDATKMILHSKGETRLFLQILFHLGLRISEARNLQRSDITKRADGCLVFHVLGKGGKHRNVIMGPITSAELEGDILNRTGFIFPGRGNKPLSRSGASKRVGKAMKPILQASSAHWMRHCHATSTLRAGAGIVEVSRSLGHANITTTNSYLHADQNGSGLFLECT